MSDSTSDVRARRLRLNPWLHRQLAKGVPGIAWHDEKTSIFKISWEHGSKKEWTQESAEIFKSWAIHTGKYNAGDDEDYSKWKRNLRCALYKAKDIEQVTGKDAPDENRFRFYQFMQEKKKKEFPMYNPDKSLENMSESEKIIPGPVYDHVSSGSEPMSTEHEISFGQSSPNQHSQSAQSASPASTNEILSDLPEEMSDSLDDEFLKFLDTTDSCNGSLPSDVKDVDIQPLDARACQGIEQMNQSLPSTRQASQTYTQNHIVMEQACQPTVTAGQSIQNTGMYQASPFCSVPGQAYSVQNTTLDQSGLLQNAIGQSSTMQNQGAAYINPLQTQNSDNNSATLGMAGREKFLIDQVIINEDFMNSLMTPTTNMPLYSNSAYQTVPTISQPTETVVPNTISCPTVIETKDTSSNTVPQNTQRKVSQNKRKRYSVNVIKPLKITSLSELDCDDCAYGMAIEIMWKGRVVGIWHSNNQFGCRLIPENTSLLEQEDNGHDDMDAEDKYGKQFHALDTIRMPLCLESEKSKATKRGIILRCNDGSISVIRLCRAFVYSSVPLSGNNHKLERSKDQTPNTIFNFRNKFLPALQNFKDKKAPTLPDASVSLYFGQETTSADNNLFILKVSSCRALSVLRANTRIPESLSMPMSEPNHIDIQVEEGFGKLNISDQQTPYKRVAHNGVR